MCRKKKKIDNSPREERNLPAGYPYLSGTLSETPEYHKMRDFLIYNTRAVVARHYYYYGKPYDVIENARRRKR